jgi:branched-chain amino acid transport system permease protein
LFGQLWWYGLEHGAVYVVFAMGLTLGFGVMGIMNLAHGEICMLGAMGVYTLMAYLGLSFFPAAALSIVLVSAFGVLFNWVAVRPLVERNPMSVLLATIAMSFILVNGGNIVWGTTPKVLKFPFPHVFRPGGVAVSMKGITLVIVSAIAVIALYLFLGKTQIGKVMRATSQHPVGARLVGINIRRTYTYTMVVASALAAIAGIFLLPLVAAFPAMGQGLLITGFVVVIVGGMGNVTGCVVVGLAIGIIEAMFGQYVNMLFRGAFIYGIMIVVLLLKPEGLFARR